MLDVLAKFEESQSSDDNDIIQVSDRSSSPDLMRTQDNKKEERLDLSEDK